METQVQPEPEKFPKSFRKFPKSFRKFPKSFRKFPKVPKVPQRSESSPTFRKFPTHLLFPMAGWLTDKWTERVFYSTFRADDQGRTPAHLTSNGCLQVQLLQKTYNLSSYELVCMRCFRPWVVKILLYERFFRSLQKVILNQRTVEAEVVAVDGRFSKVQVDLAIKIFTCKYVSTSSQLPRMFILHIGLIFYINESLFDASRFRRYNFFTNFCQKSKII
jgi:hypothetical protein